MTETTTTLDRLVPGQAGTVERVGGNGAIRRRLLDMGITRGVEITAVKTSPLGDPVEYRLRGYSLSLRKSEAQMIEVAPLTGSNDPVTGRPQGQPEAKTTDGANLFRRAGTGLRAPGFLGRRNA
jgi:Fe2+ transport system protein FeoA